VATATEELKRTRRALADVQASLLTLVGAGGWVPVGMQAGAPHVC
jgi:hypothetical protein